jgi:hypothetical protein
MAQVDNGLENKELNTSDLDMVLNNKVESYQIIKKAKMRPCSKGSNKCLINYEDYRNEDDDTCIRTRKRSDSIKLYKKHKRDRENHLRNNNNQINNSDTENEKKFKRKSTKNLLNKKVSFLSPNFITIIDVESYKKYNEENTYKDPFDDIEIINNMKIDHIEAHTNGNEIVEGKESVHCSCSIF